MRIDNRYLISCVAVWSWKSRQLVGKGADLDSWLLTFVGFEELREKQISIVIKKWITLFKITNNECARASANKIQSLGPVSDLDMLQVLLYRCLKCFFLTHQLNYLLYLINTSVVNWLGSFSFRVIQQHSLEVSLNSPGERKTAFNQGFITCYKCISFTKKISEKWHAVVKQCTLHITNAYECG